MNDKSLSLFFRRTVTEMLGFLRCQDGNTVVEFAISAAAFAIMLIGILEFGIAGWGRNGAASDAREGTRYAVVHGSTSGRIATEDSVTNYVRALTSLGASIRVHTSWEDPVGKAPGTWVKVTVVHDAPGSRIFLHTSTDSASSQMTILY